jgi:hypothetical protein
MRTIVRRDLHDEDAANYRWTDDELDRHIAHAVKEFSEAIPYEQKAIIATTAGSRELDISSLSDRNMLEAVEYPIDLFPRSYQRFAIWGDTLTLLGDTVPDGSNCYIYYGKPHTLSEETSTVPPKFDNLVATGAEGYALLEWAAFAINQVNIGGTDTPKIFTTQGEAKLSHFRKELKRLGRRNRVRISRLYIPAQPIRSILHK